MQRTPGSLVRSLECLSNVVTHSIRLVIKKRVIVDKITVVAQDERVKK